LFSKLGGGTLLHSETQFQEPFLKRALNSAVDWGLIRHSPAQAVRAPNVARKEMRALDADEVKRLLSAAVETERRGLAA